MKVSTTQPFQIVYSIFQHEYLGYLFESFVIQVNSKGDLTFQNQNISSQNAREFSKGLDEKDYELIQLVDEIQQEYIIKKFYQKKIKPKDFFLKIYDAQKGDKAMQKGISLYLEEKRQKIIQGLRANKMVFVMGKDGSPIWKKLNFAQEAASVLFHFRRNEDNTHYFPTIKYQGAKLDFQYQGAFILGNDPAWMVLKNTLHYFSKEIDGKKIKPFLRKKFIAIPRKLEATYYRKFVAPLVANCHVYARGFEIKTQKPEAQIQLQISEYQEGNTSLFEETPKDSNQLLFKLFFNYDRFSFLAQDPKTWEKKPEKVWVHVDQEPEDQYTFYRVYRDIPSEVNIHKTLANWGLELKKGQKRLEKSQAFAWLGQHLEDLKEQGIEVLQKALDDKKYFLGRAEINLSIEENHDWFDIYAKIRFGDFEIPFLQLKKLILRKKTEFKLPNGEMAVIPSTWLEEYSELFSLAQVEDDEHPTLKKHHLNLLEDLKNNPSAKIEFQSKLEAFHDFTQIEEYDLPKGFKGRLRSYQKAGYNWLRFIDDYNFGGCLADDMGLGKTVQTLALLQAQKEQNPGKTSLLVIPTSLIYNWELEARKFCPHLKIFIYTGTNRNKDLSYFQDYDLIITSYGIIRIDIEILAHYPFHYVILDESQAIKNPSSNISQAVRELQSPHRLILTGTPLENSTLDLWSQMSFINPGLLGNQSYFKNEYLNPIEKKKDHEKAQKLARVIRPFIMRRLKSQVSLDLPPKIENTQYCLMSPEQAELYEKTKSQYRNEILKEMEEKGTNKSSFILLQGLTKLRQIANHPRLTDPKYPGDSGKMEDVRYKLHEILNEGHKVLIFSQFVKHLNILKQDLEREKIPFAYLDGSTQDRQAQVEKFQEDPQCPVFLISLKAGGVGLNLTAAEYVFLLDPWWNPAVEAQAVDRAHRIGQKNTVFTYKFITRDTVEEKILALQKNKKALAGEIINPEESFMKSLQKEDILSLLE